MSDGSAPNEIPPFKRSRTLLRWVLLVSLLATAIYAVQLAVQTAHSTNDAASSNLSMVRSMGLIDAANKGLAPKFHDAQGRLVADAAPPDKCVDPDTLVLAHIVSDNESSGIDWKAFAEHLAKVTGKKVTDDAYDNSPEQHTQIAAAKISLVALHAVDAPFLVNNFGFQPVAVLGDENGAEGNHLDIIVPADSSVQKLADLREKTLVCTIPTSITGYRAAVVSLMEGERLRPNVDYYITWSMTQTKGIEGVARKQFQAAAVSDDKLQTLLNKKRVDKSAFRQIYQSAVIPRTTIGWFYDLKPELAAKVKEAILSFRPRSATADASGDVADTLHPLHFIAIDYKKDFKFLREIDDHFDPRFGAKVKARETTAPTTR